MQKHAELKRSVHYGIPKLCVVVEIQRESRKECAKSQALRTMKGRPLLTIYRQVGNNRGSSNRGVGGSRSSQVERLKKPKNLQAERASRKDGRDLPGGAMDKNSPANAGDRVRSLVREDFTCRGETRPLHRNY